MPGKVSAAPMGASSAAVVSLGMPAYNSERFIAQSIDSLLAQDYSNFELLISDNASTDRTGEICREYAARDSRIRYLRQPRNIGAVANWNFLVRAAGGSYFKWSSSNDLCAPNYLSRCVEQLNADPSLVLCYGRTVLINDQGVEIEEYRGDLELMDARPSVRFRRACQEMRLNNAQCAVIRLAVLRATKLERPFPQGDMPLMAELALHGKFRQLPEVLLYRRMDKQSATRYMTQEEQARFRNPALIGMLELSALPTVFDHARSVFRAPVAWRERFACLSTVVREAVWARQVILKETSQWFRSGVARVRDQHHPVVALLGAYSSRNFGDTAIINTAVASIRARLPGAEIVGISPNAVDTLQTHGLLGWTLDGGEGLPEAISEGSTSFLVRLRRRWSQWLRMVRIAAKVDLLVVAGSGQLSDYWGGPWGHPWALLAWTVAFRLRGRPVAVVATGVDELETPLGRWFTRWALALAKYRSVRDPGSLEALRQLGFRKPVRVCPDLAFGHCAVSERSSQRSAPRIVVCPISQRAFRRQSEGVYERYLAALARVCAALAEQGCEIVLSNSQSDMDGPLIRKVYRSFEQTEPWGRRISIVESTELQAFLRVVKSADLVIASRLHALILSVVSGAPIIAVSYSRKVTQLMADLGQQDLCIELQQSSAEDLLERARFGLAHGERLRNSLRSIVASNAAALDEEYAAIASMVARD